MDFALTITGGEELTTTRIEDALVAKWIFDSLSGGNIVEDVSGVGAPLNLTVDNPANVTQHDGFLTIAGETRIHSGGSGTAQKVYDACTASEEMTIEAWIRPAVTGQGQPGTTGPARIITMSDPAAGTSQRNFLLGQGEFTAARDDHLRARVRSSVTNEDGSFQSTPPLVSPDGTINETVLYHVALTVSNIAEDADEKRLDLYVNREELSFSPTPAASALFSGTFTGGAVAWDRDYQINVANEDDSDGTPRYWLGELHFMCIHSRALGPDEVEANFHAGPLGDGVLPPPTLSWETPSGSVAENAGTYAVNVLQSGERDYAVSSQIVASGTAVEGVDYTLDTTSVTFEPGETVQPVQVTLIHDQFEDGDKILTLTIQDTDQQNTHDVTILDVDRVPTIGFAGASSSVIRPGLTSVPVELDSPYLSPITISVQRGPASLAVEGQDFDFVGDAADGTLTVPAGVTQVFVDVQSIANGDGDEALVLELSNPSAGNLGLSSHTVTIREESQVGGTLQSSVEHNGITWTFDQQYLVGSYVCGDPWVVGPCTVTSVSPAPGAYHSGSNGSLINPDVRKTDRVDGRLLNIAGQNTAAVYDPTDRVSFPVVLNNGDSLLSTESNPVNPTSGVDISGGKLEGQTPMRRMAVLTCVDAGRPATEFRPALIGTVKTRYDSALLNVASLPSYAGPSEIQPRFTPRDSGPSIPERFAVYFRKPWVFISFEWLGRYMHASENMPNYHGDVDKCIADAMLMLCSDIPLEQKQPLLEGVIQVAIDMYAGLVTGPESSDKVVSRLLLLFAAQQLGDASFSSAGMSNLKTEYMPGFLPSLSSVTSGIVPVGETWTGYTGQPSGSGVPYWRHLQNHDSSHEHLHHSEWNQAVGNGVGPDALQQERYRGINSSGQTGMALVARMLGLKDAWGNQALFDYADRWMVDGSATSSSRTAARAFWGGNIYGDTTGASSSFATFMWNQHRGSL